MTDPSVPDNPAVDTTADSATILTAETADQHQESGQVEEASKVDSLPEDLPEDLPKDLPENLSADSTSDKNHHVSSDLSASNPSETVSLSGLAEIESDAPLANSTSSMSEPSEPSKQSVPENSAPPVPQKTSLYSTKKPPKDTPKQSGGGQWSSLLKRALANVESTIDNVIQESTTSDIGAVSKTSSPTASATPPTQPKAAVNEVRPAPGGRLTMDERLALAIKQAAATPRTSTSSPRPSIDNISPQRHSIDSNRSSLDLPVTTKSETPAEVSEPIITLPTPSTVPSSVSVPSTPLQVGEEPNNSNGYSSISANYPVLDTIIKHIESLTSSDPETISEVDDIKKHFKMFLEQLESREVTTQKEIDAYVEKTSSLESKLVFLSRDEAERAHGIKLSSSGLEKKLAEKEEQVALLMEEGQMLSKKELKNMNTIKMYRSKAQEQERIAIDAKDRQSRLEREVSKLKEKIRTMSEVEKRQTADIKFKSKIEGELENLRKEKLDNQKTIESLREELTQATSKYNDEVAAAHTKALNAEKERASELQRELSKVQLELSVAIEKHQIEISELESRMSKDTANWESARLKMERNIRALDAKAEMYRGRSEELTSGTSSESQVTLLRQIEVLQSQHSIATENWSGIEQNLQNRISSLEQQLQESSSREAYFKKKVKGLVSYITSMEMLDIF